MTIFIIVLCILALVLLITWGKLNAFLAFLIVSIATGLLLGIPLNKITGAVQKGIGDTLGSLVIVIALGAMLGKLVADCGVHKDHAGPAQSVWHKAHAMGTHDHRIHCRYPAFL